MEFEKNLPFIRKSLEVSQISFSGGRTAVSIAAHGGITQINYYGAQRFQDVIFYKGDPISAWAQLFRPCVEINGDTHYLEFNDTLIYPFGYSSRCLLAGVMLEHGMWLLNDSIVFTLDITRKPKRLKIFFKLLLADSCARINKPTRTWKEFSLDKKNGSAVASTSDSYPRETVRREKECSHPTLAQRGAFYQPETAFSETWIGIASGNGLEIRRTPQVFKKFYFKTSCRQNRAELALVFGHQGRRKFKKRLEHLGGKARHEVGILRSTHAQKMEGQPAINIQRKTAQSLLMNVAPVLDALKVRDIRGGIRAADSGYWIWGWDSIVHAEAHGFANDATTMVELLDFYRRTACPEYGIFHEMTLDQRPFLSMAFSSQCLYAILLYHAYAFTGDRKMLLEYIPFAGWIINKASETEVAGAGLVKGVALYPDHPEDIEQNGNDLSVFNNSIYYQALVAMSELSRELGDEAAAAGYAAKGRRTLAGFQRFYDPEKGYFFDSLSAEDFSPRRHYPLYAILWVTPFARDLLGGNISRVAKFMVANFTAQHGLRLLPKWDSRFMFDGNQLGMYMPCVENFYREMMKCTRNERSISKMFDHMEWFWNQLCIPEALTCEFENHGITLDNPGRKQAFCAKAWLTMFYHVAVGINISLEGLSFSPSDSGNLRIHSLVVRGKKIDIEITGHGWNIGRMSLNGKNISEPFKIPFDTLRPYNQIVIHRKR